MAVKGSQAKECLYKVIQNVFPNSFMDGKELRVNLKENGEELQLKIAATVSKTPIQMAGQENNNPAVDSGNFELTQEEKDKVKQLIFSLGIEV